MSSTAEARNSTHDDVAVRDVVVEPDVVRSGPARIGLAVLRLAYAFTFLWAFFDKLLGLHFSTPPERAWIRGGNPTAGFLGHADGTFGSTFQSLAGQPWVSPLFMFGLLAIGTALLLGMGMRIAAIAGAILYVLMWLASLPIATNPFLDDHLIGAIVLIVLALTLSGDTLGLGKMWARTGLVRKAPILR